MILELTLLISGLFGILIYIGIWSFGVFKEDIRVNPIDNPEDYEKNFLLNHGKEFCYIYTDVLDRRVMIKEGILSSIENIDYRVEIIFGKNVCRASSEFLKKVKKNKNIHLYHVPRSIYRYNGEQIPHFNLIDGKHHYREEIHEELEQPKYPRETLNDPFGCAKLKEWFDFLKYNCAKEVDKDHIIDTILRRKGAIVYPDKNNNIIYAKDKIIMDMKNELGEN